MFFGGTVGKRLEPVSNMSDTVLERPGLHACCNAVGCLAVQRCSVVNAVDKGIECSSVKILAHLVAVEYQFAEVIGDLCARGLDLGCLLLESVLYYIKS